MKHFNKKVLLNQTSAGRIFLQYFLIIAVILSSLIFGLIEPVFLTQDNIMNILRASSITAMLALSGMFIMLIGDINFAMGAQAMVSAAIVGKIMDTKGNSYILAIIIGLVAIIITGIFMGWVVIRLRVPALICTMAMNMILIGVAKVLTDNKIFISRRWPDHFFFLGQTKVLNSTLPLPLIIFIVFAVMVYILTEHTRYGRHLFSVGANQNACRQVGIDVDRVKYIAYVLAAFFAGVAGILHTSYNGVVSNTMGTEMFTPALCAVFLGATCYRLGTYNVVGTFVASVIMSMITNGVLSLGLTYFVKDMIEGAVLLVAVGIIAVFRKDGLPKMTFNS